MANIVIKDLLESIDLDRQAMTAITGGSRFRGPQPLAGRAGTLVHTTRIIDYPTGFGGGTLTEDKNRPVIFSLGKT